MLKAVANFLLPARETSLTTTLGTTFEKIYI